MKKKSKLSKVLALCLAMVMVFAMSVPAFAAISDQTTGNFTITGFDTTPAPTVSAYQIITVNVADNGQPEYPMYTWVDAVANWVTANYSTYIDQNLGTNAVADAFENADAADVSQFLERMTAAIKNGTITGINPTVVTASNGEAAFTNMAMGEYLITANGGVKIYQPTTVKLVPEYNEETNEWNLANAVIGTAGTMKSVTPDIPDKDASTEDSDKTVAIGDTVTYTLTVNVPSYPADATNTKFEVSDALSAGLTFNGTNTIHVYSDADLTMEIPNTNYSVTAPSGNRTFLIAFNQAFTTGYAGDTLYITYTATVNENAFEEDALGNDAFLGYNNDPYTDEDYETPGTHEDVYTYGINLTKINEENTALQGAQFTLSDQQGTELKFTETTTDGVYKYDPAAGNTVLEVSADGVLQLQGLDEGTYKLKETKAPDDYVLPTGEITIVITDQDGAGGTANGAIDQINVSKTGTIEFDNETLMGTKNNIVDLDVINTSAADAGFQLPTTGGMGTMIFTILGVLLMAGAVTMVVVISRKKRA
ncbi:MAG: SpaH/EbpB family LPXTG-anchored major pilin [Ruminococcus sp.]|jgi:fimbrial isopeptide formation D2 family protein/LPXTG-motif cell wall-anchored protein